MGQVNDYTYKDDPEKAPDSRYIHRGKFNWDLVENIEDKNTVQGRLFHALSSLEEIRRNEPVFSTDAEVYTKDYSDTSILWIVRKAEGEELHAVFNFSDQDKEIWMPEVRQISESGDRRDRGDLQHNASFLEFPVAEEGLKPELRLTTALTADIMKKMKQGRFP